MFLKALICVLVTSLFALDANKMSFRVPCANKKAELKNDLQQLNLGPTAGGRIHLDLAL